MIEIISTQMQGSTDPQRDDESAFHGSRGATMQVFSMCIAESGGHLTVGGQNRLGSLRNEEFPSGFVVCNSIWLFKFLRSYHTGEAGQLYQYSDSLICKRCELDHFRSIQVKYIKMRLSGGFFNVSSSDGCDVATCSTVQC